MKTIKLCTNKEVIVDDEDYDYLNRWKWGQNSSGYARRTIYVNKKYKTLLMHRFIINAPEGKEVDHINGNKLDNRRENLRLVSRIQNSQNKKAQTNTNNLYKGYYKENRGKRLYVVEIIVNTKKIYIGKYSTELEAAKAYNDAAVKYFGEFAKLNNIPIDK